MRKIHLVAVGKIKESYIAGGIAEYAKRLSRFCDFSITEIPDAPDGETAVKTESDAILKKIKGKTALFDIGGEMLSSNEFSGRLSKFYAGGADTVTLIIGGSAGVNDSVKNAADIKISFGKVTYPHQLMRLIAAEQIYRAFTIMENLPYHK